MFTGISPEVCDVEGLHSCMWHQQGARYDQDWHEAAHSTEEGFTPLHTSPCEISCDNKLAFQDDNCAKKYPTAPANLPFDHSKCVGASMLKYQEFNVFGTFIFPSPDIYLVVYEVRRSGIPACRDLSYLQTNERCR